MAISNQLRDLEVAYSRCITNGTSTFKKVVLVDGRVLWYDSADVLLPTVPTGTLSNCSETTPILNPTLNTVLATSDKPATIPANVISFTILNAGLNGAGIQYADVSLTGGFVDTILAKQEVFSAGVEEDNNKLGNAAIVVTPATGHEVKVYWLA